MRSLLILALLCSGCGASLSSVHASNEVRVHRLAFLIANVYAIDGPEGVVLVDTGDPGQDGEVLEALRQSGIDRDRVRLIVVTHAHADHAGSAHALAEALGVPIALQSADAPIAAAGHNPPLDPTNLTAEVLQLFLRQEYTPFTAQLSFDACLDLHPFGVPAVARSTPGHTPGSSVVLIEGGDAIVGDLVAGGYLGGFIAPTVPTEHYYQAHPRRVRAILEWLLRVGVTRLHLGHGGPVRAADLRTAIEGGDLGPGEDAPFEPPPCE
jgi:glyoxylase-like metal-dependent hydrolase (beta-lactamase superfamily II)